MPSKSRLATEEDQKKNRFAKQNKKESLSKDYLYKIKSLDQAIRDNTNFQIGRQGS